MKTSKRSNIYANACSLFSFCRMDSFFLAEMFKYLYLLFADKEDLTFDIEDYIFTTEAHLLPLWLSTANQTALVKNIVSFALQIFQSN